LTITLKFAAVDGQDSFAEDAGPRAFIEALGAVSGGRIKAEIAHSYGDGEAQAEVDLIKAVTTGDVDGAWPAARAFATAGISGLAVLEAPLTILSDEAAAAVSTDPVSAQVLGRLDDFGLKGLAVVPGGLMRPFSVAEPLRGVEDWEGIHFRSFNSQTQAATIKALGAAPVNVGISWPDEVAAGRLDGVDAALSAGAPGVARNLTANVVLWPKFEVFVLNPRRYNSLTDEQRRWVAAAAQQAVAAAGAVEVDEASAVVRMCNAGVRVVNASEAEIASLRAAVRPVMDELATDATMARIAAIADTFPEKAFPVPPRCTLPRGALPTAVPDTVPPIQDGAYRATVTPADVAAAGGDRFGIHPAGVWTVTFSGGTYTLRCDAVEGPTVQCGGSPGGVVEAGSVRGDDEFVYLTMDPQRLSSLTGCTQPPSGTLDGHCGPSLTTAMGWTFEHEHLTFTGSMANPPADNWLLKPYTKIS
jgi:TRAP-type C4-dicarboxylate transport system substrate-binding protein